MKLTIRNHTDACIIAVAMREHCRQAQEHYQRSMMAALAKGQAQEARNCRRYRDEVHEAGIHFDVKLQEIIERFERAMPDEPQEEAHERLQTIHVHDHHPHATQGHGGKEAQGDGI